MQLTKFSWRRNVLNVSFFFVRPIFNFNFVLQVEVYMAPSTLKSKMKIGSDEKFETDSEFHTAWMQSGNSHFKVRFKRPRNQTARCARMGLIKKFCAAREYSSPC
jgi:hypothetical protein